MHSQFLVLELCSHWWENNLRLWNFLFITRSNVNSIQILSSSFSYLSYVNKINIKSFLLFDFIEIFLKFNRLNIDTNKANLYKVKQISLKLSKIILLEIYTKQQHQIYLKILSILEWVFSFQGRIILLEKSSKTFIKMKSSY